MNLQETKRIGALLRCFAMKDELVPNAVTQTMSSVERMQSIAVGGRRVISRIEILVPSDPSYVECDCGMTVRALRKEIDARGLKDVFVNKVKYGDLFVGILNYGVGKLLRAGCDYGLILSKEAESYYTQETVEDLLLALENGARVAGVAINELTESIMQGRIANTFAVWHLMSLVQKGIFDERNAKVSRDAPITSRAQSWDAEKQFWHYDLAGVEEIIPLIKIVRTFGACIAPILPRGEGISTWNAPDPVTDPEGYIRHLNKLGTKFVRQSHFASEVNADLPFIKGGVMEKYRHPEYFN